MLRNFNAAELGKTLREVAVGVIRQHHANVLSRWFHSTKEIDLFIWTDIHLGIIKQQLSYLGQVVEWNAIEGVKTGKVVNVSSARGHRGGSEILQFDDKPQPLVLQQALGLLSNITALKEDERQNLLANFQRLGASQTMPPEEFIARFGELVPPARSAESWHTRILRWFKA